MRADTKEYQIFWAFPFGFNVRRDLKKGGYEWMVSSWSSCSAGDFDFRFAWFLTKWGARRAIKRDGREILERQVETIST